METALTDVLELAELLDRDQLVGRDADATVAHGNACFVSVEGFRLASLLLFALFSELYAGRRLVVGVGGGREPSATGAGCFWGAQTEW